MKTTQQFINYFNKPTTLLVEDGILGGKSQEQVQIAISKLQNEFAKRGWVWDNKFNFIGIRTDNDFDDTFEDWFILTMYNTIIAVPSTTVAGVTSVWKYLNLWVQGKKGVGTIKANQQIDYLLVEPKGDAWTGWTGNKGFLYQDKPIDIHRGAIQDNGKWVIDLTSIILQSTGNGMNVHTWAGFWGWVVGNLSEGCQCTREEFWNVIFPILVKNAKVVNGQKRITYSLIQL